MPALKCSGAVAQSCTFVAGRDEAEVTSNVSPGRAAGGCSAIALDISHHLGRIAIESSHGTDNSR